MFNYEQLGKDVAKELGKKLIKHITIKNEHYYFFTDLHFSFLDDKEPLREEDYGRIKKQLISEVRGYIGKNI